MDSRHPLLHAEEFFALPEPEEDLVEQIRTSWGPNEDDVDDQDVYAGDKMLWVGIPGRMMRLGWDQVHAFLGNPFDTDKVAAYAQLYREGDAHGNEPLVYAPPAMLSIVTLQDVRESQEAALHGELFETHGMSRPFTTGDTELDEYLADTEGFIETYADDEDDEAAIHSSMTLRAEEAIEEGLGDLGKLTAQLRDGNHRAFAAQIVGEPFLWVIVRGIDSEDDLRRLGLRYEDFE